MPASDFELSEAINGTATVLRVNGRLDAKSAPVLLKRCHEIREEKRDLILNLSGVTFIASSGIGSLLALAEEFKDQGLQVRYAALSMAVESVIKLLNLDSFLNIDVSEEESLQGLAA